MARAPRQTSGSKARSSAATKRTATKRTAAKKARAPIGKASKASTTKTRAATKTRKTPQKRTTSRAWARRQAAPLQTWGAVLTSLITSSLGREILADVLEAAAAALKKERPAFQAAGEQQIERAGEAAADIGTEIVSGTTELARTAVGVLTDVVTDALGGPREEDDSTSAGSRGRRQQT